MDSGERVLCQRTRREKPREVELRRDRTCRDIPYIDGTWQVHGWDCRCRKGQDKQLEQ
jgi:hypothetical protein